MNIKSFALLLHRVNYCYLKGNHESLRHSVSISFSRKFSQWHMVSAVCLERKPVISQRLTPLEERYFKYIQKLEVEKSLLSDHEKREIEDQQRAEKLKSGEVEDMDVISKQTAQDFEDACAEELNKFNPGLRRTEADSRNDRQSLQRKLDSTLLLVTKQKLGNDHRWIVPQAVNQNGETLRQTAERALADSVINPVKVKFMGNSPVGYLKYKYPKAVRGNGICGAKVFFFKAQLLPPYSLQFKLTDLVSDYLWLMHSELEDVLQPVYCKVVLSFLFPDSVNKHTDSSFHDTDDHVEHQKSSAVGHA